MTDGTVSAALGVWLLSGSAQNSPGYTCVHSSAARTDAGILALWTEMLLQLVFQKHPGWGGYQAIL